MARIWLDGSQIKSPQDFYSQFFAATQGLVPDLGGPRHWNLDGLNDDLRELAEPLTVVLDNSEAASRALGEWFGRCVATLIEQGDRPKPVVVILAPRLPAEHDRLCLRCGQRVDVNAPMYEVFERMHWTCFHYEFEHNLGGVDDPDQPCSDPSCPSRRPTGAG